MITADNVTDEQIRELRDGKSGLNDESLRALCVVALRSGDSTGKGAACYVCHWRKGGTDSWDGKACKCGLRSAFLCRCDRCGGIGRVPYDIGTQPCTSCDGSGLFDPNETHRARVRCAEILNARAKETP